MKLSFFILVTLFLSQTVFAQSNFEIKSDSLEDVRKMPFFKTPKTVQVPIADDPNGCDISTNVTFFQNTLGQDSFAAISQKPFQPLQNQFANTKGVLWLRFTAHNTDTAHSQRVVFYVGKPFFLDLYSIDTKGRLQVIEGGTNANWNAHRFSYDGYGLPIELLPSQVKTFYIRVVNDDFYVKNTVIYPLLYSENSYKNLKNSLLQQKYALLIFYALTLGGLLFVVAFSGFQYLYKKDKALLNYTLVAFLTATMLLRVAEYHLEIRVMSMVVPYLFSMLYIVQYSLAIAYFLFIISIFNLKTNLPRLYKSIRWIVGLYVVALLVLGWFTLKSDYERRLLFSELIYFSGLSAVSLLVLAYIVGRVAYKKIWLSGYILVGFGLLILGYVTVLYLNLTQDQILYSSFWRVPSVYMGLGMLAEMFCFLLALGKRTQRTEQERNLLGFLNETLEQKVEKRTAELQNALDEVQTAFDRGQSTERKRVSADLHDEIGSALSTIAIFSDVTKRKAQKAAPELVEELEKIGTKSREMVQLMRDTIWTLNDDTAQNLWERMYQYSFETLSAKDISLDWQIPGDAPNNLPFSVKRNLFLAYKEAIHNVVKHAEATLVSVELNSDAITQSDGVAKPFQITISDNGKGFDIEKARNEGNGLQNFQKRMSEIGGSVQIESRIGEGTKLVFFLPLP